jgi:hypothetical protein
VSPDIQKLGAFLSGSWNILDGLLFEKTLNLSHNAFVGELPAWALHRKSADPGLTVQLAVRFGLPELLTLMHAQAAVNGYSND